MTRSSEMAAADPIPSADAPVETVVSAAPRKPPTSVLERALLVLTCFTFEVPSLHLRDIAARTALDKATVLRILATFTASGYVQRLEDGRYALGPATLRLASVYATISDADKRINLVLQRVMEQSDESAAFYTRNGDDRICVARVNARRAIRYQLEVGHGVPLARGGAAAHILLAYTGGRSARTAEVLRDGAISTAAERDPELASLAVPVFEADGAFLGALVVSSPLSRQSAESWTRAREIATAELRRQGFLTAPPCANAAP